MKKPLLTSLILIGFLPLLTQCASQQDITTLNYHVATINKKLDDMRINTVDQMQQRQAMSFGQLDQLQDDILRLKGKLEENAHMNRRLQEQNKELQLALQNIGIQQEQKIDRKLSLLNSKLARQKKSLTAIQRGRILDAERRSQAAKRAAKEAMHRAQLASLAKRKSLKVTPLRLQAQSRKILFTGPAKPSLSSAATPIKKAGTTAPHTPLSTSPVPPGPDAHKQAMQAYRAGKFQKSFELFKTLASQKGSQTNRLRSWFMAGESLFQLREFDQAIIQYQQIINNSPGSPQVAKALLRQAQAFEQLNDADTALIIFKKIATSYSSSKEAITARKKIGSR